MTMPTKGTCGQEEGRVQETSKMVENMIGKMETRLMQRMDALEARMIAAIGEQQRLNGQMDKVCDPEDSDSPDAKRYTTMLREASKAMDRQLEEIYMMERGNKARKIPNNKNNEREGAANISQDKHGSKDGKSSQNYQSPDEIKAKGGLSETDGESDGTQSDNGYKANESESNRDEDEEIEISDREECEEENESA